MFDKKSVINEIMHDMDELIDFINHFSIFSNLNSNEFLLEDHWNNFIPNDFFCKKHLNSNDLLTSYVHIKKIIDNNEKSLFSANLDREYILFDSTNVENFICKTNKNILCACADKQVLKSTVDLKTCLGIKTANYSRANVKEFMSIKKCYEVETMGDLCNDLAQFKKIKNVIDIGSGLGYLGCYLSIVHGYDVLGIDSVLDRKISAIKRNKKIRKQWLGLVKNVSRKSNSEEKGNVNEKLKDYKKNLLTHSFIPVCEYVTDGTQVINLYESHFCRVSTELGSSNEMMFTALHACGDLSSNIMKLFVKSEKATTLFLVGCCYNLLSEEFLNDSQNVSLETEFIDSANYGFPMSLYLKKKCFKLGINARSLASQPWARTQANQLDIPDSLFWRAILQVILVDKLGPPKNINQWKVGKKASKCKFFYEYVIKAIEVLNLNLEITKEEILTYYEKYANSLDKCLAFYQLRTCMGAPIESLILLDRLLFLLEQECIGSAYLVQVFDPVTSPRCYGLIAFK